MLMNHLGWMTANELGCNEVDYCRRIIQKQFSRLIYKFSQNLYIFSEFHDYNRRLY